MSERNLNFDEVIDRKNTDSLKFDFAKRRGMPEDIQPLWVADMDFKVSSYIEDAIIESAKHGVFGYTETLDDYTDIIKNWMKTEYNWDIDGSWVIKTPGVVYALGMAVSAFSKEGDAIIINQPVYYPFSEVINDNNRKLIDSTLIIDENGKYHIDFVDFEKKIKENNVKLYFLCNPHNPGGRNWSRDELLEIGRICNRNNVLVISDEIHADFTWIGEHTAYASLGDEYRDNSVILTSPSKAFNIAGLQIANVLIANRKLRHAYKKAVAASGYSQVGTLGIIGCKQAYSNGKEWLEAVKKYIEANIDYAVDFVNSRIKGVTLHKPESTYLIWLDFRKLGLDDKVLDDIIINKAGLWLDSGAIFGESGKGFQRINVACPRETLTIALEKLEKAFNWG